MSRHRPEKVRAWRATLDAWERSGQTVNAFCRARSAHPVELRPLAADPGPGRSASVPVGSPHPPPPAFVPVRVVAEPMAEVVLRSGVVVRVPLGAAADAVTRLVAAVGAASC